MLLQTGHAEVAMAIMGEPASEPTYQSWVAEHTATGALAAACMGDDATAQERANDAKSDHASSKCRFWLKRLAR